MRSVQGRVDQLTQTSLEPSSGGTVPTGDITEQEREGSESWQKDGRDQSKQIECRAGYEHQPAHSWSLLDGTNCVSVRVSFEPAQQRFYVVAGTLVQRRKVASQEGMMKFHLCLCLLSNFCVSL